MTQFAYRYREFGIPTHMLPHVDDYINLGIEPGHFLQAIICNDLQGAVERADDVNIGNIPAYVAYFYNKAPSMCLGSKERMAVWVAHNGLKGYDAYTERRANFIEKDS